MLPSVRAEASGFVYSFLINSQWLLTSKIINVFTTVFFRKWRVLLQLLFLTASVFSFAFPLHFPFWPVLPSSLLFFWKDREHISLSIFVMKTNRKGKEWETGWWLTNYRRGSACTSPTHTAPGPNFHEEIGPKFHEISLRKYLQHKKAVLRSMWNIKNEVLIFQVWHYKAKACFYKVLKWLIFMCGEKTHGDWLVHKMQPL